MAKPNPSRSSSSSFSSSSRSSMLSPGPLKGPHARFLVFLLITLTFIFSEAVLVAGNNNSYSATSEAQIGIRNQTTLFLAPPSEGEVVIQGFTELSAVKAQLSTANVQLEATQKSISVISGNVSSVASALATALSTATSMSTQVSINTASLSQVLAGIASIEAQLQTSTTTMAPTTTANPNVLVPIVVHPFLSYIAVFGGIQSTVEVNSTILYDSVTTSSWSVSTIGNMPTALSQFAIAYSSSKKSIYFAGGIMASTSLSEAYSFSPETKIWSTLSPLLNARHMTAGICFGDNETFLVTGGTSTFSGGLFSLGCEALNISSGNWSPFPSMSIARSNHAMVLLQQAPILIGGYDGISILTSCEKFVSSTWVSFPDLNTARRGHGAAIIGGKIYVAGGFAVSQQVLSVEVYSGGTSWTTLTSIPSGQTSCKLVELNGKLVVLGGSSARVDVYDLTAASASWSTFAPYPGTARIYAGVVSF